MTKTAKIIKYLCEWKKLSLPYSALSFEKLAEYISTYDGDDWEEVVKKENKELVSMINGDKNFDKALLLRVAEFFNVDEEMLIRGEVGLTELASTLERRVVNGFKDIKNNEDLPSLFVKDEYDLDGVDYIIKHNAYKTLCRFEQMCDVICGKKVDSAMLPSPNAQYSNVSKASDRRIFALRRILVLNDDVERLGKSYLELGSVNENLKVQQQGYSYGSVYSAGGGVASIQKEEFIPLIEKPKETKKVRKAVLNNQTLSLMFLDLAVEMDEMDIAVDILAETIKKHKYSVSLQILEVIQYTKNYKWIDYIINSHLPTASRENYADFTRNGPNDGLLYNNTLENRPYVNNRKGYSIEMVEYYKSNIRIRDAKIISKIGVKYFSLEILAAISSDLIIELMKNDSGAKVRLPFEVAVDMDLDFLRNYISLLSEFEKCIILNNYKDGDLDVVKILLENGAYFIIQGHSNPPSEYDYSLRLDKTKTALIKLQLGIR